MHAVSLTQVLFAREFTAENSLIFNLRACNFENFPQGAYPQTPPQHSHKCSAFHSAYPHGLTTLELLPLALLTTTFTFTQQVLWMHQQHDIQ